MYDIKVKIRYAITIIVLILFAMTAFSSMGLQPYSQVPQEVNSSPGTIQNIPTVDTSSTVQKNPDGIVTPINAIQNVTSIYNNMKYKNCSFENTNFYNISSVFYCKSRGLIFLGSTSDCHVAVLNISSNKVTVLSTFIQSFKNFAYDPYNGYIYVIGETGVKISGQFFTSTIVFKVNLTTLSISEALTIQCFSGTSIAFNPSNGTMYIGGFYTSVAKSQVLVYDCTVFKSNMTVEAYPSYMSFVPTHPGDLLVSEKCDHEVAVVNTGSDTISCQLSVSGEPSALVYNSLNEYFAVSSLDTNDTSFIYAGGSSFGVKDISGIENPGQSAVNDQVGCFYIPQTTNNAVSTVGLFGCCGLLTNITTIHITGPNPTALVLTKQNDRLYVFTNSTIAEYTNISDSVDYLAPNLRGELAAYDISSGEIFSICKSCVLSETNLANMTTKTFEIPGFLYSIIYDPLNSLIYVSNDTGIVIFNATQNRVTGEYKTSGIPVGLVMDSSTGLIYAALSSGVITALNPAEGQFVSNITIGGSLGEMALDSLTDMLYTVNGNYLSVVDLKNNEYIGKVDLNNGTVSVLYDSGDHLIYAMTCNSGFSDLIAVNGLNVTKKIALHYEITGMSYIYYNSDIAAYTHDCAKPVLFFNGNLSVVFTLKVDLPNNLNTYVFSYPGSSDIYAITFFGLSVINLGPMVNITNFVSGSAPGEMALDNLNGIIYVANKNAPVLYMYSIRNNSMVGTIDLDHVVSHLTFDSKNNLIYAINRDSDTISIVNASTNILCKEIQSHGTNPDSILYYEPDNMVFVMNCKSFNLSVFYGSNGTFVKSIPVPPSSKSSLLGYVGPMLIIPDKNEIYIIGDELNSLGYLAPYGWTFNPSNLSFISVIPFDVTHYPVHILKPPRSAAFDPVSNVIYITYSLPACYVYAFYPNGTEANFITLGCNEADPTTVMYSQFSGDIYVVGGVCSNNITMINGNRMNIIGNITMGDFPTEGLFDPVNGNIYVSNSLRGTISNIPTQHKYQVIVRAENLPSHHLWNFSLNGNLYSTSDTSLSLYLYNGSYNYSVTSEYYNETAGTLNVNGYPLFLNITFSESYYNVTFKETGLPSGYNWTVNIKNGQSFTTDQSEYTITLSVGNYTFTVQSASTNYTATYNATFSVKGYPVAVNITFNQNVRPVVPPAQKPKAPNYTMIYIAVGVVIAAAAIGSAAYIMRKKK